MDKTHRKPKEHRNRDSSPSGAVEQADRESDSSSSDVPDDARSLTERTLLGLDVGGTKTAVVEGAFDGRILQRIEIPTLASIPAAEKLLEITDVMRSVIWAAEIGHREVVAISVSIGGPLSIQAGILIDPPHLPGWHHFELRGFLERKFPHLPVRIEHDGNAGALAELHFGVGKSRKELRHLIFLTFGTGLGAGLIVNGQILHGATDTAGEVGHWRISRENGNTYGKSGSWEACASGTGLVQIAAQRYPTRWSVKSPIAEIVEAALEEDRDALQVVEELGLWTGRGIALLIDALNPQVIVLGSLAVALGERVMGPIERAIAEEALERPRAACRILPSVLGKRIGDIASLMAVLTDPECMSAWS